MRIIKKQKSFQRAARPSQKVHECRLGKYLWHEIDVNLSLAADLLILLGNALVSFVYCDNEIKQILQEQERENEEINSGQLRLLSLLWVIVFHLKNFENKKTSILNWFIVNSNFTFNFMRKYLFYFARSIKNAFGYNDWVIGSTSLVISCMANVLQNASEFVAHVDGLHRWHWITLLGKNNAITEPSQTTHTHHRSSSSVEIIVTFKIIRCVTFLGFR